MASNPGARQTRNLWLGLQGFNGNLLCAVDVESTGFSYEQHEIWQLCVIPLDNMIEPNKNFNPFNMRMKPENLESVDPQAMKLTGKDLGDVMVNSLPSERVLTLFLDWFEKLQLAPGKKIIPLAHNFFFDRMMLTKWLGQELYDQCFHFQPRDTMVAAAFLNDRADSAGRPLPYTRLKLSNVCAKHDIKIEVAHDAVSDCLATAKLYATLCRETCTL